MAGQQNLMDASLPHTVELSFFGEPQPQRQRKQSSPRKPSSPLRQRVLTQTAQQHVADQSSQYGTIKLTDLPTNEDMLMNESAFLSPADTTSILSVSLFEGKGRRVVSRQAQEDELEVLNENTPPAARASRRVYERPAQPMKDPRSSALRGSPARQASPRDPVKRIPSADSEDRKARLHDLFSQMRSQPPQPQRQTLAPRAGPTPPRQPQGYPSTQSRIRALLATKSPSQLPARAADRKIEIARDDPFKAPQTSSRPKSMFAAESQSKQTTTRPKSLATRSHTSSSLAELAGPERKIARSTTSSALATPLSRLPSSRSSATIARLPTSRSTASLATPRAQQDVFSAPALPTARVRATPIRSGLPSSRSTTGLKDRSSAALSSPGSRSIGTQEQRNSPRQYRMSRLSNEASVGREEPVRRMR